jgi:hypothetical protein
MFDISDEPEVHYGSGGMSMDVDDARRGAGDDDVVRNVVCTKQHERRLANWLEQNEPYTTNSNPSPHVVKIALSLFKVQQSIYLLDFQRVEGDAYGYMKLCALIVAELKNLSSASRSAASSGAASSGSGHPLNPSLSRGVPVAMQPSGQRR